MPVRNYNVVQDQDGDSDDLRKRIGYTLWTRCMDHFTQTAGHTGLGLGYRSCRAAVAIICTAGFETCNLGGNIIFSIAYGSSRLHTGLDPFYNQMVGGNVNPNAPFARSANEQHAEQTAIRFGQQYGYWAEDNDGHVQHVFVDFAPCENCNNWLESLPDNWVVHYRTELNAQGPVIKEYEAKRKAEFGRTYERKNKKRKIS